MKNKLLFSLLSGMFLLCACSTGTKENASEKVSDSQPVITPSAVMTETIMSRRSIQKYKPQAVEKEKLNQIVTNGIWAPNGQGRESWQIRVVSDPKLLSAINERYGKPFAYGAPAVVFIGFDPQYDLSQVDCGLLGGNMILTAQSMGIGSCCLGGIVRFLKQPENKDLLQQLQLPESHELLYAIAFGYPDESPKAKERHTDRIQYIE